MDLAVVSDLKEELEGPEVACCNSGIAAPAPYQ
jgi:hypothetical protein